MSGKDTLPAVSGTVFGGKFRTNPLSVSHVVPFVLLVEYIHAGQSSSGPLEDWRRALESGQGEVHGEREEHKSNE